MSVNDTIAVRMARFRALSPYRQQRLRRAAKARLERAPHTASASTFWRGLSALQVIAASTKGGTP